MLESYSGCVLVTGVGGYLGAAIAEKLYEQNFRIIGIDRQPPMRQEILDDFLLINLGQSVRFGEIMFPHVAFDAVIHAAGGATQAEVDGQSLEATWVEQTFQDNFYSGLDLILATKRMMNPGSSYSLISSINAFGGYGLPVYSAAKAATHGYVLASAPELMRQQITINAYALGTIDHPGVRKLHAKSPGHFENIASQFPNNHLPNQHEMASEIVLKISQMGKTTGSIQVIDFGQTGGKNV